MCEYQYYEFQAVDRPLTKAEQEMPRELSTRARITATSFTNHYEWGDFNFSFEKPRKWGDCAVLLSRSGVQKR